MLIRTLSALQDRTKLTLRILLYYLAITAVGLLLEHYLVDMLVGPGHHWAKFTIDASFRIAIGLILFLFASKLIMSQESARAHSMESTLELLERLALASEYRDDITAAHNSRIGQVCGLIGEELGLDEEECELLRYAASLHDIGKVAIPDRILQKPGPLTSEERSHMQKHVLFGADLLLGGGHPIMDTAYNIALTHHEAWDGKGYPNKLSGAQIPLCGRIVAVCDTFDALISERPYKEAWPVEDAVIEVLRQSGRRFDPVVVRAFRRALPKIIDLEHVPAPARALRDASCYVPVNTSSQVDLTRWYPEAVACAQKENEESLGRMLLKGPEVSA